MAGTSPAMTAKASVASAGLPRDAQPHIRPLLQIADDAEQIFGLRIAARAERADQALGRRAGRRAEFFEADGGLDVIAQDGLSGVESAAEHGVDAFAQQGFGEFPVGF